MKVCVINSLYSPYHRGGAEVVAAAEARRFKNQGDEVLVITAGPWAGFGSLKPRSVMVDGIKVYRFYPLNIFSFININQKPFWLRLPWHLIDLFNIHSYFAIKGILKKEKPDLVASHNLKGLGYLTWRAISSLGLKNSHTLHDVQLAVPSGLLVYGQERRWPVYEALCRCLCGSPTEVISPSKWLLDFYTAKGFFPGSRKTVKPAFGVLPPVKLLNLKVTGHEVKLLFVGQIERHKGVIWLVKTLKESRIMNHESRAGAWQLEIVGDGSKLEELKSLVAGDERFKVYGRLEGDKLLEKLKEADFTVVSSLVYENSPTIIASCLQNDIPVIASAIGGIPEMVKEGVNGYLFQPGKAGELEEILREILG
ncbi:MAG: glycosyltransferase [Patescibacteria group bacterium]|jgi:glycosyltransferase involved in cell wall biosynthesis